MTDPNVNGEADTGKLESELRKRRRSEEAEPDVERIDTACTGSSISAAPPEEPLADILPAGTFYTQLVTRFASRSPRSRSPVAADRSSGNTLGKLLKDSLLSASASIENLPIDHHVQITDENCDSLSPTHPAGCPEFLRWYGNLVLDQTRCLKKTCRMVLDAVGVVYQDEINSAAEFAQRAVLCTVEQPCSPRMSVEEVDAIMRENFDDVAQRRKAFSSLLPGFLFFDQHDQNEILATRYLEKMMFHRARMIKNNVIHYWTGRKKVHVCTPWFRLLTAVPVDRNLALADVVNELHLDYAESYLAMCLAFFRPGSDMTVRNQSLLHFLYAHYLDAFHHLVSSRSRGSRVFYDKFGSVVAEMPFMYRPDTSECRMRWYFKNRESPAQSSDAVV